MSDISTGIILLNNAFQVSEQNTQSSHQASVNWGISWLSLSSCVLIFFFIPAIRNQNTSKCSVELWNWAVKWLAMFISIVLLHCCMQIYATYFNGVTSSKLTNTEIAVVEDLPQPHFFFNSFGRALCCSNNSTVTSVVWGALQHNSALI